MLSADSFLADKYYLTKATFLIFAVTQHRSLVTQPTVKLVLGMQFLRLKTAHMPITLGTVIKTMKELFLQILLGFIIEFGKRQKSTVLVLTWFRHP